MDNKDLELLGKKMVDYCSKFGIPIEFLFHILEDQKVTPMVRGKAMEYNLYSMLIRNLSRSIWSIEKLNLNAQPGTIDEDISITHRRTGIILKVESKSAVRGSFTQGKNSRILKEPHFSVKCHKSRSNIRLAGTTNDKYSENDFDLIFTNPTNSIYQGNTISEGLEIIHDIGTREFLCRHYNVQTDHDLIISTETDWRFCIPESISIRGFIPRTPRVKLLNDENWNSTELLEEKLLQVVEKKRKSNQASRRN